MKPKGYQTMVPFGLTGWDAESLLFVGLQTATLGLENLGLRTLTLTPGPKSDANSKWHTKGGSVGLELPPIGNPFFSSAAVAITLCK